MAYSNSSIHPIQVRGIIAIFDYFGKHRYRRLALRAEESQAYRGALPYRRVGVPQEFREASNRTLRGRSHKAQSASSVETDIRILGSELFGKLLYVPFCLRSQA